MRDQPGEPMGVSPRTVRGLTPSGSPIVLEVIALEKDAERFVFLYDEESKGRLLQTLGQFAADKDLSFTWYDAAVISQKVRATFVEKSFRYEGCRVVGDSDT